MFFSLLIVIDLVHLLVKCQELDIVGKNSMLYDPVSNLPYPCDSETKPSKKSYLELDSPKDPGLQNEFRQKTINNKVSSSSRQSNKTLYWNKKNINVYKRADGDTIPIKLQPCPFPNGTQEHRWLKIRSKHVSNLKKLSAPTKVSDKRNDVIRKISSKEEAIRGQLYAGTHINTGYGVGLSGAALGVLNMLPYVHAFDTETGMPYVCDPNKKKPDEKIDNRWNMKVPPCPDFKKCLFPWKEAKDCETKVDNNQAPSSKRQWVVKLLLIPVLIPAGQERI